jgi:hypothetical protein
MNLLSENNSNIGKGWTLSLATDGKLVLVTILPISANVSYGFRWFFTNDSASINSPRSTDKY